jgi:hypothetical protein
MSDQIGLSAFTHPIDQIEPDHSTFYILEIVGWTSDSLSVGCGHPEAKGWAYGDSAA